MPVIGLIIRLTVQFQIPATVSSKGADECALAGKNRSYSFEPARGSRCRFEPLKSRITIITTTSAIKPYCVKKDQYQGSLYALNSMTAPAGLTPAVSVDQRFKCCPRVYAPADELKSLQVIG